MGGYTPSRASLTCSTGVLSPSTFTCSPNPCAAPTVVNQANGGACNEGGSINSGYSCSTQCAAGRIPSRASLTCSTGVLSPSTFTCSANPCTAPTVKNQANGGACSEGGSIYSGFSCSA